MKLRGLSQSLAMMLGNFMRGKTMTTGVTRTGSASVRPYIREISISASRIAVPATATARGAAKEGAGAADALSAVRGHKAYANDMIVTVSAMPLTNASGRAPPCWGETIVTIGIVEKQISTSSSGRKARPRAISEKQ